MRKLLKMIFKKSEDMKNTISKSQIKCVYKGMTMIKLMFLILSSNAFETEKCFRFCEDVSRKTILIDEDGSESSVFENEPLKRDSLISKWGIESFRTASLTTLHNIYMIGTEPELLIPTSTVGRFLVVRESSCLRIKQKTLFRLIQDVYLNLKHYQDLGREIRRVQKINTAHNAMTRTSQTAAQIFIESQNETETLFLPYIDRFAKYLEDLATQKWHSREAYLEAIKSLDNYLLNFELPAGLRSQEPLPWNSSQQDDESTIKQP